MPKPPLFDAKVFFIIFSFFGAQELLNEPHFVWFKAVFTFDPKYAQTSTFGQNFFLFFVGLLESIEEF